MKISFGIFQITREPNLTSFTYGFIHWFSIFLLFQYFSEIILADIKIFDLPRLCSWLVFTFFTGIFFGKETLLFTYCLILSVNVWDARVSTFVVIIIVM